MPGQIMNLYNQLPLPGLTGLVEIVVLALVFYLTIRFLQGTRGVQVLYGFILMLIVLLLITNFFNLSALTWLLQGFSVYFAIAFVIIFQPEIRRALAEIGKQPVFSGSDQKVNMVQPVVQAVMHLAGKKIGALIAIEREIGTRAIQESGTRLDSLVTPELLASLFFPHTPLHDGGVIIQRDRLVSAGCVFPLSSRQELSKTLGTRHRAAIGLTEETDALVIVVSEETGTISVAFNGKLRRGLDEEKLTRILNSVMGWDRSARTRLQRAKNQLDLTPEGIAKSEAMSETQKKEESDG